MRELCPATLWKQENSSLALPHVLAVRYPWEILASLGELIRALGEKLPRADFEERAAGIWVARSAKLAENVSLTGPLIIDAEAELRPGAFVRGGVIIGRRAVVGNSTELKNCILFDEAAVPHYNYVGDSILGYHAHLGAGAVTSNVKGDNSAVVIHTPFGDVDTGRRKCGAFLGDRAEVGCHAVLNPGTVIGCESRIYPLSFVRGYVPPQSIHKQNGSVVLQKK